MMATKRQTWAIFCATGLDGRGRLSFDDASDILNRLSDESSDKESIIADLQALGCTGKPKLKKDWAPVWKEAYEAGKASGEGVTPKPMGVTDGTQTWVVEDGVCGFAWIKFPGNSSFGRWMKKQGLARKAYPSGLSYWVSEFNQSMNRKEAFASAAAEVLRKHGIKAYSGSRMD